ncbi:DNA gyrase subunit A [Candidatus Dojkabacteria bacterium]|nr:DNA gyrase subunit A [Candidatus Dojkabacteria bacterium]
MAEVQTDKPLAESTSKTKTNEPIKSQSRGAVIETNIVDEMKKSYIDYSMSVIVARALPDVRDGLKPSQRRILVAMNDLNLTPTGHYIKCAKIIGDATGNYHPHGDAAAYGTLVNMAQDFSTRYQLVFGQGNFGSIDGDPAAHMRYTEAKMTRYTVALLEDLEKGAVSYQPNYDARLKEPSVLPGLFPGLICNGAEGIAVGMATKIPPHNLSEITDALINMVDLGNKWSGKPAYNRLRHEKENAEKIPRVLSNQPESCFENYLEGATLNEGEVLYPTFRSEITVEELMKFVKGPDFPTYGIAYNKKEMAEMYATGRGRVLMRAKADIEELKGGKFAIIITELPFQTNKAFLIEKIASLVKLGKIKGISGLRDESTKDGIRVVVELSRNSNPQTVLNKLFKYTDMQKAFNANMIALVDGEPRTLTLREILEQYLTHRIVVTIRKNEFNLSQARYREHILEGLKIALDFLDEVIATIRASKNQEDAKVNLITKFKLTEVQAQAILDMQLRRLAALERQKIEDEYKEVQKNIKDIIALLESNDKILSTIKADLLSLKEKYGDARRTKIVAGGVDDFSEEDLVTNEPTIIALSSLGYIKRTNPNTYRTQKRGGKGSVAAKTKDGDFVKELFMCETHDSIMFFTSKGKVFVVKAYDIPEYGKQAKGIPIVNFIQIDADEKVTAVLPKRTSDKSQKYFIMSTKQGIVKKTKLSEFDKIRASGLIAISLNTGDELSYVKSTSGKDNIMLITREGKSIQFKETDVKSTGRNTKGVTGIKFASDSDFVVSMDVIPSPDGRNLIISDNGYGKFTSLTNYPTQKRGGKGVKTMEITTKTGKVAETRIISNGESEIMVVSEKGVLIRIGITKIPTLNRITQGVRIMKLDSGDKVASLAVVEENIEEPEEK